MDCVTLCPDTAILGKVLGESEFEKRAGRDSRSGRSRDVPRAMVEDPQILRRSGQEGRAKGACSHHHRPQQVQGLRRVRHRLRRLALKMIPKTEQVMTSDPQEPSLLQAVRPVGQAVRQRQPADRHDAQGEDAHLHRRRGQLRRLRRRTALRMMCAATGAKYGDEWGIVAATGCNTVYTSTYPYNPYLVPWTNSLFENAPAMAMGVRSRWDQMGWQDKPIWCIGGDGAMFDIGFQSLSRHVRLGHEHQGVRARHAGLFQHRRPGLDQQLHRPEHQDERARQGDRRQAGAPQGDRPDRHDAPADVRGPDDLRPRQPLLSLACSTRWSSTARRSSAATPPASRSTAWPTTWPPTRPAWRSIRGPSRC